MIKPILNKRKWTLAIFIGIMALLTYLVSTAFKESLQYYVTASELVAHPEKYKSKLVKVAGHAQEIIREEGTGGVSRYRFQVVEGGAMLPVLYEGLVPDTFKNGSEVVATGRWIPGESFVATEILAKCASKYEAELEGASAESH